MHLQHHTRSCSHIWATATDGGGDEIAAVISVNWNFIGIVEPVLPALSVVVTVKVFEPKVIAWVRGP